jgi:signal transduction histidine kinase
MIGLMESNGSVRLLSIVADPSKSHLVHELESCHPDVSAPEGMPKTIRTGQALLYPKITDDQLSPDLEHWPLVGTRDPKHLQTMRALGLKSYMVVPLAVRGKTMGAIMIASSQESRTYSETHLEIAKELAHRSSIAVENAQLYRDAQSAIQLRDDFLSIASHELKTPLTSLAMQIQMISYFANQQTLTNVSREKMTELAKISEQQVKRFSSLINDLLDVARISAGHLILNLEECDLPQLVREVINRFSLELEKSRNSVELRGDTRIIGQWDRIRVEQIVTNLLSNAMKYGAGKPIEITTQQEGGKAKLVVRDHGIGISESDQARIFEQFERAVSTKRFGGLGLGLFIVRQIVKSHGGTIRVVSEVGEGSSFSVELPLKAPSETK